MSESSDPFRPPDDEARTLARELMAGADHAALAVTHKGAPFVTRVAFGLSASGAPLSLISDLAPHTGALRADPAAALLLGEPGPRGDPLIHPRLTLIARARFVAKTNCRETWLARHPKARLYVDFTDFHFVEFDVSEGHLNGGFGRAYRLSSSDMSPKA